ncbi:MAG: hypothetical protein JO188_12220 [Hyphomicrobiales bacterium]|nr:hypothetical protein [Hyphomicrobiales bacterium]
MGESLKSLFTSHPDAVGESYGEHFGVAMSYSGKLFAASCAAFVHALLPFLFVTTASSAIKGMYANMTRRGATSPSSAPSLEARASVDYAI